MKAMTMKKPKQKSMQTARRAQTIFYICVIAIPLLNFVVLQFYQNYLYAFIFSIQKYDYTKGDYVFTSDVFYNFRNFFQTISGDPRWKAAFGVSIKSYLIGWVTSTPISLLIPFYIYRKFWGTKLFKFILMMPSMIASVVWTSVFLTFSETALVELLGLQFGPFSNPDTQFAAMTIRGLWTGMAGSMLVYTGTLSGISDSVLDAGKIDGLTPAGELIYLAIPRLWPIFSVGIFTGISGIFTGYGNVLELFGYDAGPKVATVGYLMFTVVLNGGTVDSYGFNAAGSLVLTFGLLPMVFLLKSIVERFGPTEEERQPIEWFWNKWRKNS